MKTNNKGFSLVELIVVIAIMAILAAVAIPTFASFIDKANIASDVSFVNDAEYAAELANAINGKDLPAISVKVENKKATEVIIGTGSTAITVKADGTVTPNEAGANDWAKDIYEALDWDYTFKKYTSGTYELSDDGKTLETVTP